MRLELYISIVFKINFGMEVGIWDFATVAGSTAGNNFPSLADSFYMAYQLQGTTMFPLLQDLDRPWPWCLLSLGPFSVCLWAVGIADHIPSREQQPHFLPIILHVVISGLVTFQPSPSSISSPLSLCAHYSFL